MTELDLNALSTDELTTLQKKINKILERRAGGEAKKLRAQMQKMAKSMGYELVPTHEPVELGEEAEKPERRGRKPKPEPERVVEET